MTILYLIVGYASFGPLRSVVTTLITLLSTSRWTANLLDVAIVRRIVRRVLPIYAHILVSSGKQVFLTGIRS
jgi:hypothetical protein